MSNDVDSREVRVIHLSSGKTLIGVMDVDKERGEDDVSLHVQFPVIMEEAIEGGPEESGIFIVPHYLAELNVYLQHVVYMSTKGNIPTALLQRYRGMAKEYYSASADNTMRSDMH